MKQNNMQGLKNISVNKKNSLSIKIFGVAGLLVAGVFLLNFFNAGIKNTFYSFVSPMQKTFWSAGESCSGFLGSVLNVGNLAKENQNLKSENQNLLLQVSVLQAIKDANAAQTNISLACQNSGFNLLMAGVIGLDDQDILSINKGSADGVAEGMPVIDKNSVLFGKVIKVYKNFSKVMLISSKDSVVSARIQQSPILATDGTTTAVQEIDGIIKGTGGLGAYLDMIPVDSVINSNDTLITSALEKTFPKDLLIGKITKVIKNDQNAYQQAEISPFLDIKTDNLFVITNYKQKTN
jgi:rod shape-determining protein MreC